MVLSQEQSVPMAVTEGGQLPPPITHLIHWRQTVSQPVLAAFMAGGIAGAVSRTVVSPLERLKILYQVQSAGREDYKMSVKKGLAKMWREEGWRGMMRGNGANCLRIVPYSAVQFGSYNFYKRVSYDMDLTHRLMRRIHMLTSPHLVCRIIAGCRPYSFQKASMWSRRWYHICRNHLSSGHCPHSTLGSICIICRAGRSLEKSSSGYVGHNGQDV